MEGISNINTNSDPILVQCTHYMPCGYCTLLNKYCDMGQKITITPTWNNTVKNDTSKIVTCNGYFYTTKIALDKKGKEK